MSYFLLHTGKCNLFGLTSIFKNIISFQQILVKIPNLMRALKASVLIKTFCEIWSVIMQVYTEVRDKRKAQDETFICGEHVLVPLRVTAD
jgi:hypothetical protein